MDSNSIELQDKDSKGENLIQSAGNFDESELKKRKMIRILIIISALLLITIIVIALYFCLNSKDDKDYCDKGENEKCLTCKKKSKECGKCNPYFRLENGKCVFIYSFEAIYEFKRTNDLKEETKLFNIENLSDYQINKIQVDDQYFEINTSYYKFTTEGEHKVRINIDLKNSSSLGKFFENINELISVNFSNDFNTTGINYMNEMFSFSQNLISINLSNLKTENVFTMKEMFSFCTKLVEVNLQNLNTKKVESTAGLFLGCKNLTYLDISNLELENNKDMSSMFSQCNSLESINFGFLNTKNVKDMSYIFKNCVNL